MNLCDVLFAANHEKMDSNADFLLTVKEFGEISDNDKSKILETTHTGALLLRNISELRLTYIYYR